VQKQIKKAVVDFVKGEFKKELIDEIVLENKYPINAWKKSSELGFPGISFSEKYDGEGLGQFEKVLIAEELCRGDASVGACIVNSSYGAEILDFYGNEIQKNTWLPKVANSEILISVADAEEDENIQAQPIETVAIRDGENWVINGKKTLALNAGNLTGIYVVLCRTNFNDSEMEKCLSMILVEADRPGIRLMDREPRIGYRQLSISNVEFQSVRVPLNNLIGAENKGFSQYCGFLNYARLNIAAQALGIAQGAFDRSFAYVKQREQFKKKIVEFQVTRYKLADMTTEIEASRLLTYHAALALDKGNIDSKLCAMAKLHAARTAVAVCDEAIQLHGGYGYIQEYEVERFFRDAKTVDILMGNRNLQKNAISDALLGNK
jgi:alkylation response protein AidB-like acyl-CoA dehydrogenase